MRADEHQEIVEASVNNEEEIPPAVPSKSKSPRYRIEDFVNDPKAVLEFTGLEYYEKFMTVFISLGLSKNVGTLKYESNNGCGKLSLENQLFLTL